MEIKYHFQVSIYHAKDVEEKERDYKTKKIREKNFVVREKKKKVYKKMTKFWNIAKQSFYSHSSLEKESEAERKNLFNILTKKKSSWGILFSSFQCFQNVLIIITLHLKSNNIYRNCFNLYIQRLQFTKVDLRESL